MGRVLLVAGSLIALPHTLTTDESADRAGRSRTGARSFERKKTGLLAVTTSAYVTVLSTERAEPCDAIEYSRYETSGFAPLLVVVSVRIMTMKAFRRYSELAATDGKSNGRKDSVIQN